MARATGDILRPLIKIDEESGCWLWQGKIHKKTGYGYKQFGGRTQLAHRWVFSWFHGWIPDAKPLDHTCRVRACVNPSHLEVVTQSENCRRGLGSKLTIEQVIQIRAELKSSKWGDRKNIAARYGVSPGLISSIKHGHAWADVHAPNQ